MKFTLFSILSALFLLSSLKAAAEPAAATEAVVSEPAAESKEAKEGSSSGDAMDFKLDEDMIKQLKEMFGDDIDLENLFGDEDEGEKADL